MRGNFIGHMGKDKTNINEFIFLKSAANRLYQQNINDIKNEKTFVKGKEYNKQTIIYLKYILLYKGLFFISRNKLS